VRKAQACLGRKLRKMRATATGLAGCCGPVGREGLDAQCVSSLRLGQRKNCARGLWSAHRDTKKPFQPLLQAAQRWCRSDLPRSCGRVGVRGTMICSLHPLLQLTRGPTVPGSGVT
jgi:hypothetical protein